MASHQNLHHAVTELLHEAWPGLCEALWHHDNDDNGDKVQLMEEVSAINNDVRETNHTAGRPEEQGILS